MTVSYRGGQKKENAFSTTRVGCGMLYETFPARTLHPQFRSLPESVHLVGQDGTLWIDCDSFRSRLILK